MPGEVAGGHRATEALIDAGHQRIAIITGELWMDAARDRLKGYRQALATADIPYDPALVREGNWQPSAGYDQTTCADGSAASADRDLLLERPHGGRLLRGAEGAAALRFPATSR